MVNKFFKIFYALIAAACVLILSGGQAAAYNVSGVVAFSYYHYETKTGKSVTTTEYWTQDYRVSASGILWDPRFMNFTAGVGYTLYTYTHGQNYNTLTYNLNTNFFPGRMVSWNLFGNRSITNVESSGAVAGNDITTTTYGGALSLHLNRGRNGGNSNMNGNNTGQGLLVLPDITLSRVHTEAESSSQLNAIHETRDDTRASIAYRPASYFNLNLDGGLEEYKNLETGAWYKTKTANMTSNIQLSSIADLKLTGNLTDRETASNLPVLGTSYTSWAYGANLNFRERNRFQHYYTYNVSETNSENAELTTQQSTARVLYRVIDEVSVRAGLDYSLSDFTQKPNPAVPGDIGRKEKLETIGATAGASYGKQYTPKFMGPFAFITGYDFGTGYSRVSAENGGSTQGSGMYYTNSVNLGVNSTGLDKESLSLMYNYSNKRDMSPVHNDSWQHSYRLYVDTRRIPRTTVHGSASYTSQESKADTGALFLETVTGTKQEARSFQYNAGVDHTVSSYLSLSASASRGQTSATSTTYTLATPASSTVSSRDEVYNAWARFSYPITRTLLYRAQLAEEYRKSLSTRIESHYVVTNLDYRIRQIFLNFEYRWREDIPDKGDSTVQQYYFVKLSRPF